MVLIGYVDQVCYECHWISHHHFLISYCLNFYQILRQVLMGERVCRLLILKDGARLIYKSLTFLHFYL